MCGIVGYIGQKDAIEPVMAGLQTLEYRGYDSVGLAYVANDKMRIVKEAGRVESLAKHFSADRVTRPKLAIGHTRWATHGAPTRINAHPHQNSDGTISVVHNGIIENHQELKSFLMKHGYKFVTQTDTEVIPHMIDFQLRTAKNFTQALEATLNLLRGAYAIAAITSQEPDTLFAARLSSPLVIGVGDHQYFVASDPNAIMQHTKKVVFLNDNELAVITGKSLKIRDIKKSIDVDHLVEMLDYDVQQSQLGDFPHFMLKEIFESPQTVRLATLGRIKPELMSVRLGGLNAVTQQLRNIDRIIIVACGTSYYAGLVGEYLIEEIADIPVEVQLASEFKYRAEPITRRTCVLAVSQSGETADTIAALKKAEDYGVLRLGVVNAVGSTIARLTDAGVYCHAGPEQSVASTKAFIAQVSVLMSIALFLSRDYPNYKPLLKEIVDLPSKLEDVLKQASKIEAIAKRYQHSKDFLYIGRGYLYPSALEGALKLKELAYIHAEGYAAGEMKHGPLAMIDENFPTLAICCQSELYDKTISNIQEIKARKGPVIAIATDGDTKIKSLADEVIYIPDSLQQTQPILVAVVLQLFAYYVAVQLKLNVDRPRNLAKSVTVE